jgi:hypothetical protein
VRQARRQHEHGYIDQSNRLYRKIVRRPEISVEHLDEANEVLCKAIAELQDIKNAEKKH